ncbi:MAG: hypothetical protein KDD11_12330, partial [Acidobacteria bacterium]|nr:hypothetical protein [Acidobacteriota bacterium]
MNISTRLVLAGLLVAIAAAEPSSAETFELGPPLLQVTAQGVEVTDILLPFCGVSCHATDPTFVTHQVTIGIDGAVAAVRTRNRLEDDDPALTEVVAGQGRAATYRQLRQALVAARIGVAEGGCRLGLSRSVTSGSTNGVTISSF